MTAPSGGFTDAQLLSILALSKDAIGIYTGEELTIQFANDAMIMFWGKTRAVIGKPLEMAVPELDGQPFPDLLREVWRSGKTYRAENMPAELHIDGKRQLFHFDYEYRALADSQGNTHAILHTANEVSARMETDRVHKEQQERADTDNRRLAVDNDRLSAENTVKDIVNDELSVLNEELGALNEELNASNEELNASNEELNASNEELTQVIAERTRLAAQLTESELRFRRLVEQAPTAIVVFRGSNMVFDLVNQHMLNILEKNSDIIGRPLLEGMPEMAGQAIVDTLYDVYRTGRPFTGQEVPVTLQRKDLPEDGYFNISYTPVYENNSITGVLGVATEVTAQVTARKITERAEVQLRLALASADLGIWYINTETREFVPSPRLKELFGFYAGEEMPYEAAITQITDEYRDKVTMAVESAITSGSAYDMEYPIIGFHDQQLRWVRATGNYYPGSDSEAGHFSGTIADITERKLNEQRKNDFIGIVSHELRSPLTSLNGYVQMLNLKAKKAGDAALIDITNKAKRQVDRMTALITGFLDVARLGEGKIQLNRKYFDMADLVKLAEEESIATITTHQVIFAPVAHTPVEADQDKIEQVLVNLINNAVKYSPPGSNIHISALTQGGLVRVTVKDEGIGISAKDQAHVFDRFYRVDGDHTRSIKGFGIGLYLCREIIERHGGRIGVNSEPGQGSEFWFELAVDAKA